MSGFQLAALLLAAALLVTPPASRLRPQSPRRRAGGPLAAAGAIALAGAAVLAPPSVVLFCLVLTVAAGARFRRRNRDRIRRDEAQAVAAALELLVGELRVGAHPAAAFQIAASESGGPVRRALQDVASRAQLGADVAEGLRAAANASSVPAYWGRLAVFWELASEHGLAMSVLMRAAHRDIVERQRFADRVQAALAGARATAAILAALPLLGVALGQLIGAHPIRFLLGGGAGGVLLIVGVTLVCLGVAWADRIIDRLVA